MKPGFQRDNTSSAQQNAPGHACGSNTVGVGQLRFEDLETWHTLSSFKGTHIENDWMQSADMQFFSTGHAFAVRCSSTPLSAQTLPSTEYLLGILVSVVDEVASNSVYGPYGTAGRPKGVLDISIIHNVAAAKRLPPACLSRWLKFLQQWQNAGWSEDSLLGFADIIRRLQYRDDFTYIAGVTKQDLLQRVKELYVKQTLILMGQSDVGDFVEVVDRHFAKPNSVLLPLSHDVYDA